MTKKRDPHAPVPGRNEPCWCGSEKKYKKCHLDADEEARRAKAASAATAAEKTEKAARTAAVSNLAGRGARRGLPSATNKRPHKKTRK